MVPRLVPLSLLIIIGIYNLNAASLPNIIFMLIDDLGWNDLSYHKGSDFPSPNIDKLAAESLELNNYYIQHICSPTRSALMSGRYPIHTGLQDGVIRPTSPYGLPLDLTIIPQDLKRAGYKTHMIGKWHLGFFTPDYVPTARGYDTYFGYYVGAEDYYNHNRSYNGDDGYDFRNLTEPIIMNGKYSTYLYGNETMRLLNQFQQDTDPNKKPFFLYLPFQAVHGPLEAPQYIINSFNKSITSSENRRKKAAMVTVLDYVIGQIVQYLKSSGLWDNMIIIFSTDNGGPVQSAASNFPLRGSKATLWEGGVKGCGFIGGGWLPQHRRGTNMNALMHITDWYPTLCDIVGISPSNKSILDGYSQKDNIYNGVNNGKYNPRSEILHNIDPVGCNLTICGGIRMKQYKLVVGKEVIDSDDICRSGWCPLNDTNSNSATVQCSNNGNYDYPKLNQKYFDSHCPYNDEPCLFDIENDPCEYYDIKENNTDIYNEIMQKLIAYNATMVIPLNTIYPENDTAANPKNLGGFWGPWVNNSGSPFYKYEL